MNVDLKGDGEKLAFLSGLKQYLEDKGKILLPHPRLAGCSIDLHDLYNKVTALGGYHRVTEKELWEDLLKQYNFKKVSSTLCYGLKIIYQRFLEEYERVHYFGDDEGSKKTRFDLSMRINRRPTNFFSGYERHKRNTHFSGRFKPNNYERLACSLMSCLPNEVDFAINACTLLSGESRHVLRLSHCPLVLEALLLHAGIVSDSFNSLSDIAETWINRTKHDLVKFWRNTVEDDEVLSEMLLTNGIKCSCENRALAKESETSPSSNLNLQTCSDCAIRKRINLKEKTKESALFLSTRAPGVQDYEGQRVLQIALVLLNLSFEEFNVHLLASSKPLVRFTFLCIHSNYSALRQTGLDILGNISSKLELFTLGINLLRCTIKTLEQCVLSADKFDKVRGFESLGNLCRSPSNKDCLVSLISDLIYSSAIELLTLGDIELMLSALDALYYLSKLGEESCTRIMLVSGCINTLVSLITINVRGIGSENLAKIRIVKRILPASSATNEPQTHIDQRNARVPVIGAVMGTPRAVVHSSTIHNPAHGHPLHKQLPPSYIPYQRPPVPVNQHPPSLVRPPVATVPQSCYVLSRTLAPTPTSLPSSSLPLMLASQQPRLPSHRVDKINASTTGLTQMPVGVAPAQKQSSLVSKPQNKTLKKEITSVESSTYSVSKSSEPIYTHTESQLVPPVFHYIPAPPANITLDKSPESFAQLWVWATYESCSSDAAGTPRVEMFADYAAAATRYGMHGTRQVLPAAEFGRCLQQVFPNAASRLFKDDKGQPMYHITGIKKRQTPLPVPGHHPQPISSENENLSSSTSSDQKSTTASTSNPILTTVTTHSGATSLYPDSNSVINDQCITSTSTSCSASTDLKKELEAVSVANNTDKSNMISNVEKDSSDQIKSQPMNCTEGSQSQNHCSNHNSPSESKSRSKEINDIKLNNHCGAVESEQMQNGTVESDVGSKKADVIEANCTPDKLKAQYLVKKEVTALKYNGEVVDADSTTSETTFPKKSELKRELSSNEPILVNGALDNVHSDQNKNGLSSSLKDTPLDEECVAKNTSISTEEKNNSKPNKISPQVTPIAPNQLQKHYENQKKTTTVETPHTIAPNLKTNSSSFVHSTSKPNAIKRSYPDSTSSNDATPAKLVKSSENCPTSTRSCFSPTAPALKHPPGFVSSHAPAHLQPSSTPGAYNHNTGAFPHPAPPPPPPPAHAIQNKTVIDLMAPDASYLVLMRNCGRFHFEDITDEKEDPISKSIRLTAVLILINICQYSPEGRSLLQRHEPWFAHLSMSRIDCSPMIAKLLAEINR